MRPTRLRFENVATFPTVDLTLTDGTLSLSGPNGSGKSTVLSAIEAALFADGSRDLAPMLGRFGERLSIEMEFEHGSQEFRVRRSYKGGSRGASTLDFEKRMIGVTYRSTDLNTTRELVWEPLTLNDTRSTQAELERILGLNRRTFGMSSYLAQGAGGNFCEASPGERKDWFADALDPRKFYPKIAAKASEERRAAERALEVDAARITEREEIVSQQHATETLLDHHRSSQEFARSGVEDAEFVLGEAQAAVAGNAAAVERLKAAHAAQDQAKTEQARAYEALGEARAKAEMLEPARVELAELEQQTARIPGLERAVEKVRAHAATVAADERRKGEADQAVERQHARVLALTDEHELIQGDWLTVTQRTADLREAPEHAARCDRCEQTLGGEAKRAAIVSLIQEGADLSNAIDAKRAAIAEAKRLLDGLVENAGEIPIHDGPLDVEAAGLLTRARSAAERRGAVALLIQGYTDAAARVPQLARDLQAAEGTLAMRAAESAQAASHVGNTPELQRAVGTAAQRQRLAREALDEANAQVTRLEEQLARVKQAATELEALKITTAYRQDDLDLLRLAERAFGRDGIPTDILASTLNQIEANANGYLTMMPTTDGTTLRVQLETQRAQKTVENLKETLDVLVADQDGTRAYESFSGGERARVNIALRLALAILLADRRGAESRLLAIDEIEGLDSEGQAQLVTVIQSVASRFDVILMASHYQGIRDAFDSTISVEKVDGVSRLVAA
jgi:DNA repair exonuclease SbcCD ATPase subunit